MAGKRQTKRMVSGQTPSPVPSIPEATSSAPGRNQPEPTTSTSVAPPEKKPSGFGMLILHLHPKTVPEESLAFPRTFGLGGMALLLLLVLVCTGAMLLFVYDPSPEKAYASILNLEGQVPFGSFVRAVHHWAANGLIVVAFLHLLRVFYTGALHGQRRFNWVLGLALLLLATASNFTGYLLPWDQLSFWAVTIGTGMLAYVPLVGEALQNALRGGGEVGAKTLSVFFVLHIAILPILAFLFAAFHFWLVRKAGGVMLPVQGEGTTRRTLVPARPNLVLREGAVALVLLAALFLFTALTPAPLQEQANPGMSPNPAKAPWYFMGVQELLVHLHPSYAVFVVPLLALAFFLMLPYLRYGEPPSGLWFHSDIGRRATVAAAIAALVLTPVYVVASEFVLRWPKLLPFLPAAVSNGLVPTLLWVAIVASVFWLAGRVYRASRLEAVQAVVTFLIVAFLVLAATGIFFRGEGMKLAWP